MPKLTVVVPAYNESEGLRDFHARLSAVFDQLDLDTEVLYVDDGSRDDTFAVMCALREEGCRARPLSLSDIEGLVDELGGPLLSGITKAHNRYLDNDGSFWSTYVYSAEDITAGNLNDVWSWRVDSAVTTVTLRRTGAGQVRVSAMVRTQTPQPPALAPTVYLNCPVGDQEPAAMACVPGGLRLNVPA